MAREPQRREQRRTHLDASVVPVERALIARAKALEREVMDVPETPGVAGEMGLGFHAASRAIVAAEFRVLAEELHYW